MAGFALIIKILTCGAFLFFAGPDTVKSDIVPIHEKGYCVWYGQCTTGPKAKNCFYNGPAKKLTDPKGLKLLNSLCPEFKGQHTCCSTNQLIALSENLETMAQLTARCPACWNNIRRLYCQLTCNRDQSLYMHMDPYDVDNRTSHATILSINYYVSPTFKQGLFDSCKDVSNPGSFETVLNLLCGTPAQKCTAQKLLSFMGYTANGFAPFNIYYPESLADKLSWMDITVFKCNKPFIDPQTQKLAPACSCQDCYVPPCPSTTPTPKPTYGPEYRTEQLIIRSTHPSPAGYVRYGDGKWIPFGPIFHPELLNQALDLQNHITNMKVPFEGSSITLQDICFQPLAPQNKNCAIPSIFQYFQNSKTKLNKCISSMGFNCSQVPFDFHKADFHDHILTCTSDPVLFDEMLQLPCLGEYGKPVDPDMTLAGFTEGAYNNATTMIITFVVNNYQEESKMAEVMAWEKSFVEYMKAYINDSSHANLTIHYSTPKYVQHKLRV